MPIEVSRLLLDGGGERFIDATAGGGGHIAALLEMAERQLKVLGVDVDPDAVERCRQRFAGDTRVTMMRVSYAKIDEAAAKTGWDAVDGVLLDLGQSTDQMESRAGFSHKISAPLDLRYDPSRGVTAAEYLNSVDRGALVRLLKDVGEERKAAGIASEIIRKRPLETTDQLTEIVLGVVGGKFPQKCLARVYMAIRVAVNNELDAIEEALPKAWNLLAPRGRLVALAYDSHQDRRVKRFFQSRLNPCTCPPSLPVCVCHRKPDLQVLLRHAEQPTLEETIRNPRSRSARLRAAVKLPLL